MNLLARINSWIRKRRYGKFSECRHLSHKPVEINTTYYRKHSYKGVWYIWVLVTDQGLLHIRMPKGFKPPKEANVLKSYPKGHKPPYVKGN